MRKFIVQVNGVQYDVEIEEIGGVRLLLPLPFPAAAPAATAPAPALPLLLLRLLPPRLLRRSCAERSRPLLRLSPLPAALWEGKQLTLRCRYRAGYKGFRRPEREQRGYPLCA